MTQNQPTRTIEKSPNLNWGNQGVKNSNKDLKPRLNFYNNKHAKKWRKWMRKQIPILRPKQSDPQLTIKF